MQGQWASHSINSYIMYKRYFQIKIIVKWIKKKLILKQMYVLNMFSSPVIDMWQVTA